MSPQLPPTNNPLNTPFRRLSRRDNEREPNTIWPPHTQRYITSTNIYTRSYIDRSCPNPDPDPTTQTTADHQPKQRTLILLFRSHALFPVMPAHFGGRALRVPDHPIRHHTRLQMNNWLPFSPARQQTTPGESGWRERRVIISAGVYQKGHKELGNPTGKAHSI